MSFLPFFLSLLFCTSLLLFTTTSPHCTSLLSYSPSPLSDSFSSDPQKPLYKPSSCILRTLLESDAFSCFSSDLKNTRISFIGDSIVRNLYYATIRKFNNSYPSNLPRPHTNLHHATQNGIVLEFFWDPYLNESSWDNVRSGLNSSSLRPFPVATNRPERPALIILGGGLWYLRHSNETGGHAAWETALRSALIRFRPDVVIPVGPLVHSKLDNERKNTMLSEEENLMTKTLEYLATAEGGRTVGYGGNNTATLPEHELQQQRVRLASVPGIPLFSSWRGIKQAHPEETLDGLHYSTRIADLEADMILNYACNPYAAPQWSGTCCYRYPGPTKVQMFIFAVFFCYVPACLLYRRHETAKNLKVSPSTFFDAIAPSFAISKSLMILGASLLYLYVCDRTPLFGKISKNFDSRIFTLLCCMALLVALFKIQLKKHLTSCNNGTAQKETRCGGFLHREQTDEWKGWMQVVILIYHYLGASSVTGIYDLVRAFVSSYLFMTGYGHFSYFYIKGDFGLARVVKVLVRLNLTSMLLSYTMKSNYLDYYFSPLVSFWFLVVYGTLAIGGKSWNREPTILRVKMICAAVLCGFVGYNEPLLERAFNTLKSVFGVTWSARESQFRLSLDLWIVFFGMLASYARCLFLRHSLGDHAQFPVVRRYAIVIALVSFVIYLAFTVSRPTKYVYNYYHPYVSIVGVLTFIVLRNAFQKIRDAHSTTMAWIGRCSLETFIGQFHGWLAADTKGLLMVLPATSNMTFGINFVFVTVVFLYGANAASKASNTITSWLCEPHAPFLSPALFSASGDNRGNMLPLSLTEGQNVSLDSSATLPSRTSNQSNQSNHLLTAEYPSPAQSPRSKAQQHGSSQTANEDRHQDTIVCIDMSRSSSATLNSEDDRGHANTEKWKISLLPMSNILRCEFPAKNPTSGFSALPVLLKALSYPLHLIRTRPVTRFILFILFAFWAGRVDGNFTSA